MDFASPSESELSRVRHLDARLTRDLAWSRNSSCHVWKLLRCLDVIMRLRCCEGRESAPPERKAPPRMLKAAEGIASPPTDIHVQADADASGIMTHPPCTQAVSLPPLRPGVENPQTQNQLLCTRQLDC